MNILMMPEAGGTPELMLYGEVGSDWWFDDGFAAADVIVALAQIGNAAEINVRINSPGGDYFEGVAIYHALQAHAGKVNVFVDGLAGSAASIIAMAGTVTMRTGAIMMIHDPAFATQGDVAEHEKSIEALTAVATAMAAIYAAKTGKPAAEMRALMQAETWMTAEQAIAQGFADTEIPEEAIEVAAFDYRVFAHAPAPIMALAKARHWKRPKAKTPAAAVVAEITTNSPTTTQTEEAAMADDDKKIGAAEATARAGTIIEACSKAGFAALAGPLIKISATDADVSKRLLEAQEIKAVVETARRVHASAVKPEALDSFLAEGKSLAEVKGALFDLTASADAAAPTTRTQHTGAEIAAGTQALDTSKIYALHNTQFGARKSA